MLVEENEMNRSHDDVMVVDNNEEKKKTTRFDVVKVVEGDHEEYIWLIGGVSTGDVSSSCFSTEIK